MNDSALPTDSGADTDDNEPNTPSLFIQRELSVLDFQKRVLAMAKNPETPLLERLRFLAITASNVDEFFEIRVAGLKQRIRYAAASEDQTGLTNLEVHEAISARVKRLVREQYRILNDDVLPALKEAGIRTLRREVWTDAQARWIAKYFQKQVLPVLTPIGLDPAHPFPQTQTKSLNFIVQLSGSDGFGREIPMAIVQVPRSLPRLIPLPHSLTRGYQGFVLLSSVVHAHIDELFKGLVVEGCHQFRVTRDSDLWVDAEEMQDLLKAIRGELSSRNFSTAVRLEVPQECPNDIVNFLMERFGMESIDVYMVDGPVNLHRLGAIYGGVDRPDLKYAPFLPGLPKRLIKDERNPFAVVRSGNILLHHPYQSFTPLVDFLEYAANDADVLAIKMTLYRAGSDSPVISALERAARNGKDVTAVIELRARFDEAANIDFAQRLQEVGAKVVYGIVGYKTHAKMLLIVRRETMGLRRYVHMSTGNYHARTSREYTDMGLFTCDEAIGQDVQKLFMQLTGTGEKVRLKKLLSSPFRLHKSLVRLIDDEAAAAQAGQPAHIRIRVNAINDQAIIEALYRASQAGVQIDMIVRTICCLKPGLPGVSENIRVRSVVGRFLEHTRAFCFHAGGKELIYLSSADLLGRNLHGRVEIAFPVEEPRHKRRVIKELFEVHFSEPNDSWNLRSDGNWRRHVSPPDPTKSSQNWLLKKLGNV